MSKASDSDSISLVVVKKCETELSYILVEIFKMCLKESCFLDCGKMSSVVSVFKSVGEMPMAKK